MSVVTFKYVLLLFWICYIIISALLLFTRGFLLNRNVLNNKSSCNEYFVDCTDGNTLLNQLDDELIYNQKGTIANSQFCFANGNVKSIIILVDALRYDFVRFHNVTSTDEIFPYQNKLKIIDEILSSGDGLLYKFIADPPTTTLQRINGLTTGSLPTFIDISSNFASSEITEDNVIDQLVAHNKNIVFMGDDTWVNVYPNRFHRQYPYPSFNVWDLDTVDKGIETHLIPEMKTKDWDVIIAHFLGVDHCGHTFGPYHQEMTRKLNEMDTIIRTVIDEMDEETILFILGDHGMTETGDHGGDSEEEITSAMFVFSTNSLLRSKFNLLTEIDQIDFVPTFAQIMGIPIPFSNLGSTILTSNFITSPAKYSASGNCSVLNLWLNAQQVTNYINEYSTLREDFSSASLNNLSSKFEILKSQLISLNNTVIDIRRFVDDTTEYIKSVKELCRSVWVQFDTFSMSRGLVSLFLIIALLFIIVDGLPTNLFDYIIEGNFVWLAIFSTLLSNLICVILYYCSLIGSLELAIYFSTSLASIVVLSFLIISQWHYIADHWYRCSKVIKEPFSIASRLIMLCSSFALLSNSYIIEENIVAPYLLVTVLWICIIDSKVDLVKRFLGKQVEGINNKWFLQSIRVKVIMLTVLYNILIRLSFYYWQCREEQAKHCLIEKTTSRTLLCILTILAYAIYIAVVRMCLRNIGNLVGWSPPVFIARYVPSLSIVCCGCYWLLNSLPHKMKPKLFFPWQLQLFPQLVFFTSLFAIIIFYVQPLCVFCTSNKEQFSQGNMIPTLFNKLKNRMAPGQNDEYPVVYGLATVYSAAFVNISVFISLISAIVLGETFAIVIVLMILSLAMLSSLMALINLESQKFKGDIFAVPWWAILCWCLSSSHFFYATGHHATFSSLNWNAAGLFGDITSTIIPGILVTLNTFISHIIHALMLPVLLITPYTLVAIWPQLFMVNGDVKKGELWLYEQEEFRKQEMFNLSAKYILLQAFRVFICMFSACIHSRHLMVWKIFAPKFIFEGIGFLVSLPFVLLGYCFMERISTKIFYLIKNLSQRINVEFE